ncbi:unnamed protein product, partial [Closterium sp. NIES-53]
MAIRFTVNKFPLDPESRDATGLPWGCVVQPFALDDEAGIPGSGVAASVGTGGSSIRKSSSNSSFPRFGSSSSLNSASGCAALQPLPAALSPAPLPLADDVARCEDCYAYINPYCAIDRFSWRCSLCDVVNPFSDAELRRYGGSNVADVAELSHTLVELDVAAEGDADEVEFEQGESQGDGEAGSIPHGLGEPISSCHVLDEAEIRKRPVYIAMVDVSGSEEFLELVKSSLLAALEALSPAALFGLVTFGSKVSVSRKVGLYDLQGPVAAVKSVAIPSSPSLCSHPAYIPLHPSPPPTRWVGLYDLQGPVAAVKSVAIPSSSAHRLPQALGDLLPLPAFLASLSRHKEDAAAALKTPRLPPALSPGRPPTSALTLYPSPPLPTPPLPHSDLLPLHSPPTPLYSPQPYQVGLYDLQGPVAAVKSVAIPASSSHRLPLALGDLLPLPAFLASLSRHKEHAAAALETLRPDPPPLDLDASGAGKSGGGKGGPAQGAGGKGGGGKGGKDAERGRRDGVRGFGTALDALIRYLGGMEDGPSARIARGLRADVINTSGSGGGGGGGNVSIAAAAAAAAAAGEVGPFVGARLLVFLSGAPNHGMGALSTVRYDTALASLAVAASQRSRSAKDVADPVVADKGLLQEQTPFYRELAAAAVQAGVCVDLFTVPSYASNGDENASREDGGAATADPASAAAAGVAAVTIADPPPSTPSSLPIPYCDLASLRCLSVESGGTLFLYPSLDEATLPQDIYRMLCRPSAFGGVLRLRTSRELRAVRAYGHFFPDAQYENLYHIIRCDPFDSYAFDLEFAGKAGFRVKGRAGKEKGGSGGGYRGAVLQLAFQYTVIIPVEGGGERGEGGGVGNGAANNGDGAATGVNGTAGGGMEGGKGKEGGGEKEGGKAGEGGGGGVGSSNSSSGRKGGKRRGVVLRRRLRVKTICVDVAKGAREIYESADNESILTVLTHKVIRASLEEGVREGRLLLQDWLIILTAHYNHAFGLAQFNQPHSVTRLDVSFSACPQLQPLPRLAFALLRSPLLQLPREGVHPDLRTFLYCLYSSLDPSFLMRAVYPVLSSYTTPDRPAFPRHSLSRAALVTSGSPIFLLDAFSTIIVFYSPAAPPDLPFPPPQT